MAQWSDLRTDLLENITNRLDGVDVLRFRGVCHTWRSTIPPPNKKSSPPIRLPFPMGPNPHMDPKRRRGHFELVHTTIYCLQPLNKLSNTWQTSKCWLVNIEESEEVGKVRLKDPLSGIGFHKSWLSKRLPRVLNLLDYKVSEVTKVYALNFVDAEDLPVYQLNDIITFILVKRVAVSTGGADLAVMATHTYGKLSMWRMGDKIWFNIDDGRQTQYDDVAYHKGKFYAVDYTGLTISVDFSFKITVVAPPMPCTGTNKFGGSYKNLITSMDDLFLLDWDMDQDSLAAAGYFNSDSDSDAGGAKISSYSKVYKLDEEERKWVLLKSIGDRVLFNGATTGSYSLSAQDFPGCKKSCIYYNEMACLKTNYHPGYDCAVFDIEEDYAQKLSQVFGYSGLFWPPPSWIKT